MSEDTRFWVSLIVPCVFSGLGALGGFVILHNKMIWKLNEAIKDILQVSEDVTNVGKKVGRIDKEVSALRGYVKAKFEREST